MTKEYMQNIIDSNFAAIMSTIENAKRIEDDEVTYCCELANSQLTVWFDALVELNIAFCEGHGWDCPDTCEVDPADITTKSLDIIFYDADGYEIEAPDDIENDLRERIECEIMGDCKYWY